MTSWFRNQIAINMKLPRRGPFGMYILNFMRRNTCLENLAVRLCNIEPHHNVLEVGFGPGLGLKAAYECIKVGSGKVFGVDPSEYMVSTASRQLQQQIKEGKISLYRGTVDNLPYNTDTFDVVFHVNCYYFWPSMREALRELYRVMKPGSIMISTLNLKRLKQIEEKGLMKHGNIDPLKYMVCLEQYGFENVQFKYVNDTETGKTFEAICAEVKDKPIVYAPDDLVKDRTDSKKWSVQNKMENLQQ